MQKTITKVSPMSFGHLMLEFGDDSKQTVARGDHERYQPKVGDLWPPEGYAHTEGGMYSGALRKVE